MFGGKLITSERQRETLKEVMAVYRSMGVIVEHETKCLPLHSLIATQSTIERDKYDLVIQRVRDGMLDVPFLAEEHFVHGRYRRYLIDGHTRVRALIELGERTAEAHVIWSPLGDFPSGLVDAAATYGDVRVRDMPIE